MNQFKNLVFGLCLFFFAFVHCQNEPSAEYSETIVGTEPHQEVSEKEATAHIILYDDKKIENQEAFLEKDNNGFEREKTNYRPEFPMSEKKIKKFNRLKNRLDKKRGAGVLLSVLFALASLASMFFGLSMVANRKKNGWWLVLLGLLFYIVGALIDEDGRLVMGITFLILAMVMLVLGLIWLNFGLILGSVPLIVLGGPLLI
ncbi:MAG: hypothetical protein SNJ77_02180 [Cytophagales bacterium]